MSLSVTAYGAAIGAALGATVGVGLMALWPARPDLYAALHPAERAPVLGTAHHGGGVQVRLGRWVERHGGGWLRVPRRDLQILGLSSAAFVGQTVILGLLGLATPTLCGAILALGGRSVPVEVPLVLALALGGFFTYLPAASVQTRALRARREFRVALTSYLQLIALERAAGAGIEDALGRAATVGRGWAFRRIGEALAEAELAGLPPWQGLVTLGDSLDIAELSDLGTIATSAAFDGASVADTLVAKAASMRQTSQAEARSRANAISTRMALPASAIFYSAMLLLLYPALSAIS